MHAPFERRPPQQPPSWMRPITERLSPVIKGLVIAYTVFYLLCVFAPPVMAFALLHLALGPGFYAGELWQPVTALFVHNQFLNFAFGMIGLWFVGAAMEKELGRSRFFVLFFVPAIAANLAMVATGYLAGQVDFAVNGSSLAVLALFVGFGKYYGRTPTRVLGGLVVEARVLVAILVGFSLLVDLLHFSPAALAGDVAAVVVAYLVSPGTAGGLFAGLARRKKPRHKLEVLDGGRKKPPKDYVN